MEFTTVELATAKKLGIPVEDVRLVLTTFEEEFDRIDSEQYEHFKKTGESLHKDGPLYTGMFYTIPTN